MSVTPEQFEYYMAHRDDDRRPNEIAAGVCGLVLAFAALGARIVARLNSRAKFGTDDWLICIGMLGVIGYSISMFLSVDNGEGLHIIFVKSQRAFIRGMVVSIVCYAWAVMFTKCSILLYYRRIFKVEWLHWASLIMGAIVVAYNIALIFVAGFECIPLSTLWTGKPGNCINTTPPYTTLAIINVITDVAILALPVMPVLSLNMKLKRKIQVLGIFLTGGVVCVFGIIRCVAITTMTAEDPSWNDCFSGIWSFVEISVGIVAACLPTLGPLFKENGFTFNSKGSSGGYFGYGHRIFSSKKGSTGLDISGKSSGSRFGSSAGRDSQDEYMLSSNAFYNTAAYDPVKTNSGGVLQYPDQTHIMVQKDIQQSGNVV